MNRTGRSCYRLQQCELDDFEVLQRRYPEMPCVEMNQRYYNDKKEIQPA